MTLHVEELAELARRTLRGRLERGIDTGWILGDTGFRKGEDYGEWWISHGKICGPKNAGKYSIDEKGRILKGDKETGFYIEEHRVYGPSTTLPWMK